MPEPRPDRVLGLDLPSLARPTALAALTALATAAPATAQPLTWVQKALLPPTAQAGLVYDTARDRLVLFGGFAPGALLADTWESSGTSWARRAHDASPPPRARPRRFP